MAVTIARHEYLPIDALCPSHPGIEWWSHWNTSMDDADGVFMEWISLTMLDEDIVSYSIA